MRENADLLRSVMLETGTTQSTLSRWSGVRQPTISQILSGRVGVSDEQLQRLLSCMGYDVRVVREIVRPSLNRSELRSWRLHREISGRLTRETLHEWTPRLRANLERLDEQVRGEPHVGNVGRWRRLIEDEGLLGLHRVLTGLGRDAVEMREVSPFSGVLSQDERQHVLRQAG